MTLVDDMTLPQRAVEQITIDSADEAASRMTSNLALSTSTATVETASNTNTYYYNKTTGVLSINSNTTTDGIQCNFGCKIGDVLSVEYEYYSVSAIPKLTINDSTLTPPGSYNYATAWKPVRLSVPISSEKSCNVCIGQASGIYRLKNIVIRHIKYHNKIDTSTEAQDWITATLTSPAEHYPGNEVKYCKRNGIVYIRGWFKEWNKSSVATTNYVFKLPSGYCPGNELNYSVPTSGTGSGTTYLARAVVKATGEVCFGAESFEGGITKGCSACIPPFVAEN
jgi:hypothetical protein